MQRVQAAIEAQSKKQSAMQLGGALKQTNETHKGKHTLTEEIATSLIDKVRIYPDNTVEVDWTTK